MPTNPPSARPLSTSTLLTASSPYGYCHLVGPLLQSRMAHRAAERRMVAWIAEFERCMFRGLRGQGSVDTVDEAVSRERLKLIERFEHISARWTPARYARHRAAGARAIVDLLRVEAAQRGEGARRTREVGALDAAICAAFGDDTVTLHDLLGFDDDGYLATDAAVLLAQAVIGLTPRQRQVTHLVDGIGYSVTEAAEQLGIARETASRVLSEARRRLRLALAD